MKSQHDRPARIKNKGKTSVQREINENLHSFKDHRVLSMLSFYILLCNLKTGLIFFYIQSGLSICVLNRNLIEFWSRSAKSFHLHNLKVFRLIINGVSVTLH